MGSSIRLEEGIEVQRLDSEPTSIFKRADPGLWQTNEPYGMEWLGIHIGRVISDELGDVPHKDVIEIATQLAEAHPPLDARRAIALIRGVNLALVENEAMAAVGGTD